MKVAKELLIHASRTGDIDVLKELIKGEEDLNVKDEEGNSPLMLACMNNHLSFSELIIENGADVNLQNQKGETALIIAAKTNNIEMVKVLMLLGADSSICELTG